MNEGPETRVSADELAARAAELATLPDIYLKIKAILDDPTSSHTDISDALGTDPALAARLLRVANSAFYGRPASISTISGAVGLLGTQQVHDMVLASAIIHAFDGFSSDLIDRKDFWSTSLFAASAAKALAEQCDILDCERLFVAGLLAPVGFLILCQELPQQMRTILNDARKQGVNIATLQRQHLGFDHAAVSAALFSRWGLPAALVEPIGAPTQPSMVKDVRLEASILHITALLADAHTGGMPLDQLIPQLSNEAWDATAMSMEKLRQIETDAKALKDELVPLLLAA